MRVFRFLYPAMVLLAASSCSVKENRAECPCRLNIVMDGVSRKPVSVEAWADKKLFSETFSGRKISSTHVVSRGTVDVTAICGLDSCRMEGTVLHIPYGKQMDAAFTYHNSLSTDCESVTDTVVLFKSYANIHVHFKNAAEGGNGFSLSCVSSTDAYDILSGLPLEGAFRYVPYSEDGIDYQVRVPRQRDDSLQLVLESISDDSDPVVFKLGEYLSAGGFDWTARELNDIYVEIDCVSIGMNVYVEDWNSNYYEEVI